MRPTVVVALVALALVATAVDARRNTEHLLHRRLRSKAEAGVGEGAPLLLENLFWMTGAMPKKGVEDPFYNNLYFPQGAQQVDANKYELIGYFQNATENTETSDEVRAVLLRRHATKKYFMAVRGALRLSTTPSGEKTMNPFSHHNQMALKIADSMLNSVNLVKLDGAAPGTCTDGATLCVHEGTKGHADTLFGLVNRKDPSPLGAISKLNFEDTMKHILKEDGSEVAIVGLSLGGALAGLSALKLDKALHGQRGYSRDRFHVITFGALQIGNAPVGAALAAMKSRFYTTCDKLARECTITEGHKLESADLKDDNLVGTEKVGTEAEKARAACKSSCQVHSQCKTFVLKEDDGTCKMYKVDVAAPPARSVGTSVGFCKPPAAVVRPGGIYDVLPYYPTTPGFVPNPNQHELCEQDCPAVVPANECSKVLAKDLTEHPSLNKWGTIGGLFFSSAKHFVSDQDHCGGRLVTMDEFGKWHSGATYLAQCRQAEKLGHGRNSMCKIPDALA